MKKFSTTDPYLLSLKNLHRFTTGNHKLKNMLIFDLPTGRSCIKDDWCNKTCYAKKAERIYPPVIPFRNTNFDLVTRYTAETFKLFDYRLRNTKKTVMRIHSSGDFFSQRYINFWYALIKKHPQIKFYAFTKAEERFDFFRLKSLNNFNLISSFIDGKLNYGTMAYCNELVTNHGAYLCPATTNKEIKCNRDCNFCIINNKVVFKIH